jgi:Tfp pilus assembly protein PilN
MTEQVTEEQAEIAVPTAPGPIRIAWAMIPQVNLLPIEILEGRRFRRTQVILGTAVIGSLLVGGAGTFLAQRSINDANDQLTTSHARVTSLQQEQTRYVAVPQVIAQVNSAKAARTLAMATDVLWYRYLDDIDGARPAGLVLNSITVTLNSPSAGPAGSSNPLSSAGIGSIAVSGAASRYAQVSSWLEAVNKITGFSSSSLGSAAKVDPDVTFNSSAIVDSDALSGRYEKDAG